MEKYLAFSPGNIGRKRNLEPTDYFLIFFLGHLLHRESDKGRLPSFEVFARQTGATEPQLMHSLLQQLFDGFAGAGQNMSTNTTSSVSSLSSTQAKPTSVSSSSVSPFAAPPGAPLPLFSNTLPSSAALASTSHAPQPQQTVYFSSDSGLPVLTPPSSWWSTGHSHSSSPSPLVSSSPTAIFSTSSTFSSFPSSSSFSFPLFSSSSSFPSSSSSSSSSFLTFTSSIHSSPFSS